MVARTLPLQGLGANALGRLAFLVFLGALLGYGGCLAYAMVANFDVVNLHRDAYIDDAFYYFEIARNLAAGKFSTFDGGVTRTNGYHPLWLLLVTPLYWVFDLESALFGVKALEIMLIAGGVCLIALAVRLAQLPWILLLAVLPALYGQRGMIVGMEAAAGAFLLGATLLAAVLFARDAKRWRWLLAGLAFLLPWVRLEYVAVALFVTAGLALLLGSGPAPQPPAGCSSADRLRALGLPLVAAIAGILVYFLYNGVVFGGVVPVSGAVKVARSAEWAAGGGADWGRALAGFLDAAGRDGEAVAELGGYLLAVWALCRLRGSSTDAVGLLAVLVTMLALGVETLAVKVQIAWLYDPRFEAYSHWYYVPSYLVAALMLPVRCYVTIFLLRRFLPGRFARWRRPAIVAVCLAGLALAFDPYRFTEPFRFVEERRHSSWFPAPFGPASVGFERLLPRDAVLGSWDAGAIGYFANRPVVNLDGLANSYDYQRMGPLVWDLWLRRGGVPTFGVTHLVNGVPDDFSHDFEYIGGTSVHDGVAYTLKLWPHGDGRGRASSWRTITSPSLGADGRRTGYRILRHGRVVQVFVPACAPEGLAANVPEMLAFTWREGAASRRVQRLWVRPHRTQLGYCMQSFLLPHGAETAERVFVAPTTVDRVVAGAPPILRAEAGVSVHVVQNRLIYVGKARDAEDAKQASANCLGDSAGYHYLHVHPSARRDLPYDRLKHGFSNYDGALAEMRRGSGGRCLAEVELPPIEIRELWTGETDAGERSWRGRVDGLALRPAAIDGFLAAATPIVRTAEWVLYHHSEERKLLYVLERPAAGSERARGCGPAPFFLHFHPQRVGDLPAWRQPHGFANHDFDFGEVGFVAAGRCFAAVRLPAWQVSGLVTGGPGGRPHTWRAGSAGGRDS